jgi:hypothetical protein
VKKGAKLPHDGQVLGEGTDVDLRTEIAHEVKHLVDEVLPTGELVPIGTGDQATADLQAQLETARPHERISILEAARARVSGDVKAIDAEIAAERKRLEGEGGKPEGRAARQAKATGESA